MTLQPQENIKEELKLKFPQIDVTSENFILVPEELLMELMKDLRDGYGYNFLTNLTAADYLEYLEVIYNLSKVSTPDIIQIKTRVDRKNPIVPSMVPLWGGAIWQEREVYDLLGITFTCHPDLRRILLADDWDGHPLRRDYQWEGGRD